MKITRVRVFEVEGEERSGMAIYEIARQGLQANEAGPFRQVYTQIETDEGITGLSSGGTVETLALGQLLIGEDPVRVEYLWEKLYQNAYHRLRMANLAVLDLCLWDIIGKAKNEPVYRLLGGPTRDRVRAYAGMLGFSTDPERAAARSQEFVAQGFTALKWYVPANEREGKDGLRRNVALVKAVREAVGPDIDIMVDCLLSDPKPNSILYTIDLARRLEEFRPTWLEEPLNFDDLDAHAKLARSTSIPIAFGEHFYTRWQIRVIIESGAATVLQPDPNAAGGITEMRKIAALASTYGMPVVPHANESCRNNLHFLFANTERTCPLGEWGGKINVNVQHFYRDWYAPKNGYFELPAGPGFGYELDESKVKRRTEIA
ncbi:MAG: mandelate racemase/muconate lactonizing enzyme family protein [Chloroflexi bacterium]|nr:mandelate racemase/muconate lactonizing enzyme family protein [Chloroflexota bacterium]